MNIDSRAIGYAYDYLDNEMQFCHSSEESIIEVIQIMDRHPFIRWVSKQNFFKDAKKRIDVRGIVRDVDNPRVSEFRRHFALEGLFAFTIVSVKQMEKLLPQVVVHKTEHQAMIQLLEKLHPLLTGGKMYFGNGVKQQLLAVLVNDLIKNPGYSPFSSKKDHEFLVRHTFVKHFTQGLLRIYENVTDTLAADVALEIIDYIFDITDRSDLQKFIKMMRPVLNDENRLLKKTIYDVYMNGLD